MRGWLLLFTAVMLAAIAIAATPRSYERGPPVPASTRDPHATTGEAPKSGPSSQAGARPVSASSSTLQNPTMINSLPHQTANERNASALISDDESQSQKMIAPALSPQVHELFFEKDYCNVTGGGSEKSAQRCRRAGALAEQIVTIPKTDADSWAHGMEYELTRELNERAAAGWGVIDHKAVRCNALGCVIYVKGPVRWGYSFTTFISAINSDPLIAQLNGERQWPGPEGWDQKVGDQAILVLPRR